MAQTLKISTKQIMPPPDIATCRLSGGLFPVIVAHGKLHAAEGVCLDGFAGNGNLFVHNLFVFWRELAQHEVHLSSTGEVVADAKLEAVVGLRAKHLCYVLQPVVTSVGSSLPHAYGAHGQREVIYYDEHTFYGYLFLLQPIADGVAREIHVGGGLEQDEFLVFHFHVCHETVSLVLKNDIGRLGEGVQYSESNVVAGALVLGADVAQSHNQVFHLFFSFSLVASEDASE